MFYKEGENQGKIGYVGRTNDPKRREREHIRNKKDMRDFTVIATGLTINQARVLEQALISVYVMQQFGGDLTNLRREIARQRLSDFKNDLTVLYDLIEGYNESEMLCFLGR